MKLGRIMMAEGYREFVYVRRYGLERLSSTLMLVLIFFGFVYSSSTGFSGDGVTIDRISAAHRAVGFLVWFFALDAVGHLSGALREDMHIGILEQIALSPYPLICNMFGRSLARFLINVVIAAAMFFAFDALFGLGITVPPGVVPFFIITYLGLYGLGLFFAGLTLLFKRLGPVTTVTRFLLLIFTGAIVPLSAFPPALRFLSDVLPMTLGLRLIKAIIFSGRDPVTLAGTVEFFAFVANSAAYLAAGVWTFCALERRARRNGALGTY